MLKPLALLLSALVLLAAGCGGDGGGGGGAVGTQGTAAAELLGPDTFLYAAIDTDLESSQWQQVDDLLQKFPGREKLLQELRDSLADDGVDYESEVAPALGEALYLVVSEVPPKGEDVPFYALHKPKDADKFEALLRAGDDPEDVPEFKVLDDGWYAIADSREVLDSVRLVEEGDTLASDERFTQAMDGLADDAIAKVYVSGEDAGEALREYGGAAGVTLQQFGYERFDSFAAALSAEDDGVR
nr:hypothetical protein [Actinomycetota bacterium]